jgi:hypothetical protein
MLEPAQIAERYFLESRHMLLEIAAHFDRYDAAVARSRAANGKAAGGPDGSGAMDRLRQAVTILSHAKSGEERTVALLELFAKD